MPGPPPMSTALKRLRGNPGKGRLNDAEPAPADTTAEPPENLSGPARDLWLELAPELVRLRLLTTLDRAEFALFCRLRVYGLLYLPTKPSAALQALAQSSSIARRFGLAAADRSRLSPPASPKPSKWDGILRDASG